jgi:hypothetical protein
MISIYQDSSLEEKRPFFNAAESISTLDNLEYVPDHYQNSLTEHNESSQQRHRRSYRWFWLVQALLLFSSCTFLFLALRIRLATLNYVQQFSAYCKLTSWLFPELWMLIRMLPAPAAPAVEYNSVKFNITTKANRFVGAGPDVDRAWRAISYDSESFICFCLWTAVFVPARNLC